VREIAVAKHMKPGQIASRITGEAARKRNRRRLVPDPVRLVGVGVEALMAVRLVALVVALNQTNLEIHFRRRDRIGGARYGRVGLVSRRLLRWRR